VTARYVTIGEATARCGHESVPTITLGDKFGIIADRVARSGIFSRTLRRTFKPGTPVRIYLRTSSGRKFFGLFVVKTAFESDVGLCDRNGNVGPTQYQFEQIKNRQEGGRQ